MPRQSSCNDKSLSRLSVIAAFLFARGDFMNVVTREEKKFLINIDEFRSKSHYLDMLMIQDEHNGTDGYIIRSLYFDTIYDDDFFEKLEGVETRRKIRLRIYDPKHDFAMLEMKQKQGANQKKRSLRMTKADAEALIAGKYEVLLKYKRILQENVTDLCIISATDRKRLFNITVKRTLQRKIKSGLPLTITLWQRKPILIYFRKILLCILF